MGKHLSEALRRARQEANKLLKDLSDKTGLAEERLSEFETGKTPKTCEPLARLADGYGVPYRELVRRWMLDQLPSDGDRDRLIAEVFPADSRTPSQAHSGLDAIGSNRHLQKAARRVVEEIEKSKRALDTTARELLESLRRLPELNVEEGKSPKRFRLADAQWSPLSEDGKSATTKLTVFAVKRPTPLVVELHQFPAKMAGLHRQAHLPSKPAYYELWSVVIGHGLLLVQEEAGWTEYELAEGDCGSYWSGHRHVWANLDDARPLVIFHVFFPYRSGGLGPDGPGEAREFRRDDIPLAIPEDVRNALQQALRRLKRA